MTWSLGAVLQHLLPHKLLCACVYRLARCRAAWIKSPLLRWFAGHYKINLAEAGRTTLGDYESLNDFFTRSLKAAARPLDPDPRTLVAPVDGTLTQFGTIRRSALVQAKGMSYTLEALLGESSPDSTALQDGEFATLYLAPHDYHRVHMPLDGRWTRSRYLPGDRFSVNERTAAGIRDLFCRNERVVCWFDTALGPVAIVLVGALNVSSISTVTQGEIVSGPERQWQEDMAPALAKGAELGRFNLGSTVIALLPANTLDWLPAIEPGLAVRMGTPLARLRD